MRLEKGGLITSYYEGKTRLYQFNPAYPLMSELEQLLKKAYTLLPAHEKKDYYVVREEFTAPSVNQGKESSNPAGLLAKAPGHHAAHFQRQDKIER